MSLAEETKWKERDYERFIISERMVTHKPKEPIPAEAVMEINQTAEEIFGSQLTEQNTNQ